MRERQKDRRSENLPGLHALEGKAGEKAPPAEGSVLENHRAGAGDLAGNREALDQTQQDEKRRGEPADLLVRRQEPDGHRGETHQEHAHEQHRLAAMGVAPVPEDEGADRPSHVADTVGRQRRDDGDRGVPLREEDLGKDQGRRRGAHPDPGQR